MSLLKNFVEPETTESSSTSESDEDVALLDAMNDDRPAPLLDGDKICTPRDTTPEMYAASYPGSCARAEEEAVAFLANEYLPVINVPTIRDLGKGDLKLLLRLGQKKFKNMREYALFLIAVTDYVTCVCNNGCLFDLFKSKDDVERKLPAMLLSLDSQWCRFFNLLRPWHMKRDQALSVVKLFCHAVEGLTVGTHKSFFDNSLRASKLGILLTAESEFMWNDNVELDTEEKQTYNNRNDEEGKLDSGTIPRPDLNTLSTKPKKCAYDITRYMFPKTGTTAVTSSSLGTSTQDIQGISTDKPNAVIENGLKKHEITLKDLLWETDAFIPKSSVDVLKNSSKDNKPEPEIKPLNLNQDVTAPMKENKFEALCEQRIDAFVVKDVPKISVISMSRLLANPPKNELAKDCQISARVVPSPPCFVKSLQQAKRPLTPSAEQKRKLDSSSQAVVESIDLCSPMKQTCVNETTPGGMRKKQLSMLDLFKPVVQEKKVNAFDMMMNRAKKCNSSVPNDKQ